MNKIRVEVSEDKGKTWFIKEIDVLQDDIQFSDVEHGDWVRKDGVVYHVEAVNGQIVLTRPDMCYMLSLHILE